MLSIKYILLLESTSTYISQILTLHKNLKVCRTILWVLPKLEKMSYISRVYINFFRQEKKLAKYRDLLKIKNKKSHHKYSITI